MPREKETKKAFEEEDRSKLHRQLEVPVKKKSPTSLLKSIGKDRIPSQLERSQDQCLKTLIRSN